MSKSEKGCSHPQYPLTLTAYPTPGLGGSLNFVFMKMTAKDAKEITFMPSVTFFIVLERPGKNRKGLQPPPWLDEGLTKNTEKTNKQTSNETMELASQDRRGGLT